jgi:hypothetical protein
LHSLRQSAILDRVHNSQDLFGRALSFTDGEYMTVSATQIRIREGNPSEGFGAEDIARCGLAVFAEENPGCGASRACPPTIEHDAGDVTTRVKSGPG